MKRNFGFYSALLLSGAALLSSCDKDVETSAKQIDQSVTGHATLYFTANTDLTTFGEENALDSTKVYFYIANSAYLGSTGATGYTVKVGTINQGVVNIDLPVDQKGVTVKVVPSDFTAPQKQNPGSSSIDTIRKFFNCSASISFTLFANQTYVNKYSYDNITEVSSGTNNKDFYTITGVVKAELDSSLEGLELVTAQTITFFTKDAGQEWSLPVTTDATTGKYSVNVPAGLTIYYKYDFTVSKKVHAHPSYDSYGKDIWATVKYRYHSTGTSWSSFSEKLDFKNLDLGQGELAE